MNSLFPLFWGSLLFASLLWYGFLVFYVGWKAGREIKTLTANRDATAQKNR